MPNAQITKATIFEDSVACNMARAVGVDGANITQASISAITCKVVVKSTGATVIEPAIVVADVVFDTLQTDDRWSKDETGYNFRHALITTAFPDADAIYRAQYTFTPTEGATYAFVVAYDIATRKVY
jgi:hypothetical protein